MVPSFDIRRRKKQKIISLFLHFSYKSHFPPPPIHPQLLRFLRLLPASQPVQLATLASYCFYSIGFLPHSLTFKHTRTNVLSHTFSLSTSRCLGHLLFPSSSFYLSLYFQECYLLSFCSFLTVLLFVYFLEHSFCTLPCSR